MKENIRYLIKTIMMKYPKVVKLESTKDSKEFRLDYNVATKVAKAMNWTYYFGTDLKYDNQEEYLKTLKELLKIKRALKEVVK